MAIPRIRRGELGRIALLLWVAVAVPAWGQGATPVESGPKVGPGSQAIEAGSDGAKDDLENCRVHRVTGLPGSHEYASDFIEAIASEGDLSDKGVETMWALTADLSTRIPYQQRAMYISKSTDGGATWTGIARIGSQYFDADIGEGLRNGFLVAPDGSYFVVTTQRGAFQVIPQAGVSAVIRPIPGPVTPSTPPKLSTTKKPGEPVRANVVDMTADGERLIVGYGYFDLEPKLFTYRKGADGSWVEDGQILSLPSEMDLLSMQFDEPANPHPGYLYVGTGDQAYLLNLRTKRWSRIDGVGPDSAIHGMSVVGGLHLAACWGVYNPTGPGTVRRVTNATFLLHRTTDEAGSNLRAYSIDVDPLRLNRKVVTSITGVYVSEDRGQRWRRLNDLPNGEYRSAHFNADGTILVSGMPGTFLVNPFSEACTPRLLWRRGQ